MSLGNAIVVLIGIGLAAVLVDYAYMLYMRWQLVCVSDLNCQRRTYSRPVASGPMAITYHWKHISSPGYKAVDLF